MPVGVPQELIDAKTKEFPYTGQEVIERLSDLGIPVARTMRAKKLSMLPEGLRSLSHTSKSGKQFFLYAKGAVDKMVVDAAARPSQADNMVQVRSTAMTDLETLEVSLAEMQTVVKRLAVALRKPITVRLTQVG